MLAHAKAHRFMSVCTYTKRPIYRYSLQNKPRIYDIRSWEIYADLLDVCVRGDIRDMNVFHDQHVRGYEARLRNERPDLTFLDLSLYNPYDPASGLVTIETPVYARLMHTVEGTLRSNVAPSKTLHWFEQIRKLQ
jgi:hypothetical protein